jgi:hypothetical protein
MPVLHVAGVDPGLVHTGVVMFRFDTDNKEFAVDHYVAGGLDAAAVSDWLLKAPDAAVFIEKYRPRAHYGTDEAMVKGEAAFKHALPKARLMDNTGIRKVVSPGLLRLLGAWTYDTPTHHQDLRSAARIAILGMLKDDSMNEVLADVIRDELDGRPWRQTDA